MADSILLVPSAVASDMWQSAYCLCQVQWHKASVPHHFAYAKSSDHSPFNKWEKNRIRSNAPARVIAGKGLLKVQKLYMWSYFKVYFVYSKVFGTTLTGEYGLGAA